MSIICTYIYIKTEGEREMPIINIYIHIFIYVHIEISKYIYIVGYKPNKFFAPGHSNSIKCGKCENGVPRIAAHSFLRVVFFPAHSRA